MLTSFLISPFDPSSSCPVFQPKAPDPRSRPSFSHLCPGDLGSPLLSRMHWASPPSLSLDFLSDHGLPVRLSIFWLENSPTLFMMASLRHVRIMPGGEFQLKRIPSPPSFALLRMAPSSAAPVPPLPAPLPSPFFSRFFVSGARLRLPRPPPAANFPPAAPFLPLLHSSFGDFDAPAPLVWVGFWALFPGVAFFGKV